ncbi:MAG: amidohydrolase family protein, partial [Planctomycetaceae bacterium]|nr:amidohydrolase family protein [Planctomycetaceae bacterium]
MRKRFGLALVTVVSLGRGSAAGTEKAARPVAADVVVEGGTVVDGPADLILKLGRIWTGDRDAPWAKALVARSGVIVAVGTADEVERFRGPRTRVVDRPDAFATPGLIDAHAHLSDLGAGTEEVDLRGVKRLDEVARLVRDWIAAHPGDGWVTGQNWDQSLWP